MTTFTKFISQAFHVVTCYTCGVPFGIEDGLYRRAVTDKIGSVYCPACGTQTCWTGETQDQKRARELEAQLQRERAAHDQTRADRDRKREERDHQERRARSLKGVVTMTKKRVSGGKCPCCSKQFADLADHMTTQHPSYAKET